MENKQEIMKNLKDEYKVLKDYPFLIELDNRILDMNLCEKKYLEAREVGNLSSDRIVDVIQQGRMSPAKELLNSLDKFSVEEVVERKIGLYKKYINEDDENFYHEFELDEYFITKDYCVNKEQYLNLLSISQ